jgi:hypothetical protein
VDSDWTPDLFTMEIYNYTDYNYYLLTQLTTKYTLNHLTRLITATLLYNWLPPSIIHCERCTLLIPKTH